MRTPCTANGAPSGKLSGLCNTCESAFGNVAISCTKVPPSATFVICSPRQIASTGLPMRTAAFTMVDSKMSCSVKMPYTYTLGSWPYNFGSTSPPPMSTRPSNRDINSSASSSVNSCGTTTAGSPPARRTAFVYTSPAKCTALRDTRLAGPTRPAIAMIGFTRYRLPTTNLHVVKLQPCGREQLVGDGDGDRTDDYVILRTIARTRWHVLHHFHNVEALYDLTEQRICRWQSHTAWSANEEEL